MLYRCNGNKGDTWKPQAEQFQCKGKPAAFVKTMVCWGCSVLLAQKTWLWSLFFKVFQANIADKYTRIWIEILRERLKKIKSLILYYCHCGLLTSCVVYFPDSIRFQPFSIPQLTTQELKDGSNCVESGKYSHRKEASPHTEPGLPAKKQPDKSRTL